MPISKINNAGLGTIDQINTGVTGYSLGAGNASLMKNRIINGAMVISQRYNGASVTPTTSNEYSLDRYQSYLSVASKFSVQQNAGSVTPPSGFVNYLGVTSLSAYSVGAGDFFTIGQVIEGYNLADLNWGSASAKIVTLSFQVYSSLTGTFGGSIANAGFNRAYPFTYSVPVANTWTTISVTIAGDTTGSWSNTNGIGARLIFGLGVGSTGSGTAGAWVGTGYYSATGATSVVGTSGATFYITGVQLEVGSSATGFEYVNYQTSLANCQRYYSNSIIVSFAGPTNASYNSIYSQTFATTMRSAPTITYTSTSFAGNVSSLTTTNIGTSSASINFTNSGTGAGTGLGTLNATAEL